jgi:hypothetical protein
LLVMSMIDRGFNRLLFWCRAYIISIMKYTIMIVVFYVEYNIFVD